LTAEAEHAVAKATDNRPPTARPSTARPSTATSSSTQSSSISRYIPLLIEAIDAEQTYVEDEFQAQICLGWIHWQLGEPALAAGKLPKNIEQEFSQLDGTNKESAQWTRVCAMKGSYIKGSAQGRTGSLGDALETFESALPIIASFSSRPPSGKELRLWTELYLTGLCMISSHAIKSKITPILETETLTAFRVWAKFWEAQGPTPPGGRAPQAEVSRRQLWKEYYITLSDLLQQDLPFPTTALTTTYAGTSTRLQQRAELKRVEARYETLLLSEVQFPKAEEASDEVEAFVEIVMQNWRILCGSSWKEEDLGEGGAEAVSRGVLDILYQAATKTFHSTPVLRHLFTVHLAVAEFDLAFKAFDTYLDIVKKGKARVAKTGEEEHGLDDNEIVLKAVSECIKALCRYGSPQAVEKARDLGQYFEDWLDKHHPVERQNGTAKLLENGDATELGSIIAPQTIAMAWRCIGVGYAQWARVTFEAPLRADIQLRAIKCFRKALLPQYESTTNVETLFALGTVLAERRELGAAIDVVKSGLLPNSATDISNGLGPRAGKFAREKSRIPLWHLMALLLSTRQEFVTAARSCEGAFEQFQHPKNLFGEEDLGYRSEHLKEKATPRNRGVVDDMDDFERENVLEVKMTQLALIEVLEGPEVAVNASDELLSLYARLFGDPQKTSAPVVPSTAMTLAAPPKSSAGTIRSIKGSIFGRSNRSVRKSNTIGPVVEERSIAHPRPQPTQTTASTIAPTIQVTNENGSTARQHRHLKDQTPHHHEKLQKRNNSVGNKKSAGSLRRRSSSAPRVRTSISPSHSTTTVDGEKFFTPPVDSQNRDQWLGDDQRASRVGLAVSPDIPSIGESSPKQASSPKPLPPKTQQMPHKEPALKSPPPNSTLATDSRLPQLSPYSSITNPATRFPKDQERRRRTAILVKVWLLISGFYRRATMYEDAKGAVEEAHKLVQGLEADVSKDSTGNVSIDNAGWGGGKNVGQLWGDVFSEVSDSKLAKICFANICTAWLPRSRRIPPLHRTRTFRISPDTFRRPPLGSSRPFQYPSRHLHRRAPPTILDT
jgi:hypothetical protein